MNTDKNTCSLLTYFLEIDDLFLLKLKYMFKEQSMEKNQLKLLWWASWKQPKTKY